MKKFALLFLLIAHVTLNAGCFWNGIWAEAEFLWWRPSLSNNRVAVFTTGTESNGSVDSRYHKYNWRPGVRASLGIDNLFCGWDLWGSYTYIQPRSNVALTSPDDDISSDYFAQEYNVDPVGYHSFSSLSQRHLFTYQTWEILTSKWTFITPCGVLRPFFGVEGLILDQKLRFFGTSGPNAIRVSEKIDFSGAGLKAGMDVIYPIGKGFNVFVNPSLAMVYGSKTVKTRFNGVTATTPSTPVNFIIRGKTNQLVHNLDLQIGASYATTFCSRLIGVKAGWEFLEWSNIPQITKVNATDDTLTLGFQGFFLSAFVVF